MQEDLVTAVIPTYGRRPDLLLDAAESVANQTYDDVELVVVDDSPERVGERVESEWGDALDVRCLRGEGNGASAARNVGLREANGEYVAFLDDDDCWLPQKTARQVRAFETDDGDPELGLVCVGERHEDETGRVVNEHCPALSGRVTEDLLRGERLAPTSSAMARTAVVREHDCYFDEQLSYREDNDWYIQLSRHCTVKSLSAPLVVRGVGDYDRLSKDFQAIHDTYYAQFLDKHRPLAAEYGPDCEREFVANVASSVAAVALAAGRYSEARQYAFRAVRHDPTFASAYPLLLASLGKRHTYRFARACQRRADRVSSVLN